MKRFLRSLLLLGALIMVSSAVAQPGCFRFGVINQRSALLTAQYWNPILRYASEKSGVLLCLKIGRTAPETTEMAVHGELDFVISNHLFSSERSSLGYQVIARQDMAGIQGAIVVLQSSPISSLHDLEGKEVSFPSREAFVGYLVPLDALRRAGIRVKPVFSGNQEGAMGQLKAGRTVAAGVNATIMEEFARRGDIHYRALWVSGTFPNLPLMALRGTPPQTVQAVRDALINMRNDPEGLKILRVSANLTGSKDTLKFEVASDKDYEAYREFYRHRLPDDGSL